VAEKDLYRKKRFVIAKPEGLWQSPLTWFLFFKGDYRVAAFGGSSQ
jgi:hypothetical protein